MDGTGGFVRGHTEHVTCNIGISVKGIPLFGVIGIPFSDPTNLKLSKTYIGGYKIGLHQIMHADLSMPCLSCYKSKCPAKEMMSVNSKAVYMAPFD